MDFPIPEEAPVMRIILDIVVFLETLCFLETLHFGDALLLRRFAIETLRYRSDLLKLLL